LGRIAFQPHTLSLPLDTRSIIITAFGNRYNAFGHIHLQDGSTDQCWPDIWRSRFPSPSPSSSPILTSFVDYTLRRLFLIRPANARALF
jgi:hypothetical protein